MTTSIHTTLKTIGIAGAALALMFFAGSAAAAAPLYDAEGSWVIAFDYLGTPYAHDLTLVQDGAGALTGDGGYPAGGPHAYEWTIDSGVVDGNTIHLETHYTLGAVCDMTIDGVVAVDGSMSGTWSDNCDGARGGTWTSTSGAATLIPVVPVAVVPTTKDQCKKGGWMTLVDSAGNSFKNQGDCVSFVATGGKNKGAGI